LKRIGATRVEKLNFLVYTFQARRPKSRKKEDFIRFNPVISNKAATAVRTDVRSWSLPRRSDKAIEDLCRLFNPIIWGWLRYYGRYYPSALYPPMRQLDRDLALWAKRIQEAAWSSIQGVTQDRTDFSVRTGNVRTLLDGNRMSREAKVRFRESLGVGLPRATHPVICCRGRAEEVLARMRDIRTTLKIDSEGNEDASL
jgi:hypothetical protein